MLEDMFAAKGLLMIVQFHILFVHLSRRATYDNCTLGESSILFNMVSHTWYRESGSSFPGSSQGLARFMSLAIIL
jgi:hypothetical protein